MSAKLQFSKEDLMLHRQRTFAAVFSASFSLSYLLVDIYKLPFLSYFPATHQIVLGWTPSTPEDGPAMYWYGWIVSSALIALSLSLLSRMLPESLLRWIPVSIAWIVHITLIPALIYTLKFYWR